MFPFWDLVVAPVLETAGVRRLVEIGALRGENTKLILDRLGPEAELHVIDPVPDFDPDEHAKQFAGQYVFHRDLSLNVLGGLPPMDAALVDGDHNWYTVYNELKLLAKVSRDAGAPLPVLVLHDVCWPYGRRDLYYSPETIPAEFRQPYRRAGMRPDRKKLLGGGGMNPTLHNAEVEGGPRNGVMTALDDFIAEYDKPVRRVVVPIYFGLAIVVEEERLTRDPALAAKLDRIESADGKDELLGLAEDIYMSGMVFQHNIFYAQERAIDRLALRYLETIKRGLVDAYVPAGRFALDQLQERLDAVEEDHVLGDFVSCGAGRGADAILMRAYIEAHELKGRDVWVADPLRAAPNGGLDQVRDAFERFDLLDERVRFLPGDVDATRPDAPFADAPFERIALLHLGPDLGAAAEPALEQLYPRLSAGGCVVVEEADAPAVATALEAFRSAHGITDTAERFGAAIGWRKDANAVEGATRP